jgi:prophage regulatory protein
VQAFFASRKLYLGVFAMGPIQNSDTVLRLPQVLARTGLSRSVLYGLMRQGAFPRPIKIAKRSVGWLTSQLNDWLEAQIGLSRGNGDQA